LKGLGEQRFKTDMENPSGVPVIEVSPGSIVIEEGEAAPLFPEGICYATTPQRL